MTDKREKPDFAAEWEYRGKYLSFDEGPSVLERMYDLGAASRDAEVAALKDLSNTADELLRARAEGREALRREVEAEFQRCDALSRQHGVRSADEMFYGGKAHAFKWVLDRLQPPPPSAEPSALAVKLAEIANVMFLEDTHCAGWGRKDLLAAKIDALLRKENVGPLPFNPQDHVPEPPENAAPSPDWVEAAEVKSAVHTSLEIVQEHSVKPGFPEPAHWPADVPCQCGVVLGCSNRDAMNLVFALHQIQQAIWQERKHAPPLPDPAKVAEAIWAYIQLRPSAAVVMQPSKNELTAIIKAAMEGK